MKISDLIIISTRMFKARTSRTLLTVAGMSVGFGAVLFLTSLGFGLQKTILERITNSAAVLTLNVTGSADGKARLNSETLPIIRKIQGVEAVGTASQADVIGTVGKISVNLSLLKVNREYLDSAQFIFLAGSAPGDDPAGLLLTSAAASAFGENPGDVIGQELALKFDGAPAERLLRFTVSGVLPGEDSMAYALTNTFPAQTGTEYSELKIRSASSEDLEYIRSTLMESGFQVSSISDTIQESKKVFNVIQIALTIFGVIALIVSAIGMFNTMTIALMERTEEIGIMKSIGASNQVVRSIFIAESMLMGFLGGLGGTAIGWIAGKIINMLINLVANQFGGASVTLFYVPAWFLLLMVGFSFFVGLTTGIIPARKASRIDPLDALRYK